MYKSTVKPSNTLASAKISDSGSKEPSSLKQSLLHQQTETTSAKANIGKLTVVEKAMMKFEM